MKNVSVNSDKVILDADLFQVHESEVVYDNGIKKTYKNIKRKPAVSVFPVTSDNQIYLVKQYRYLLDQEVIEEVAGFIDEGETSMEAAVRELKEESGLEGDVRELITTRSASSIVTWEQTLYIATNVTEGKSNQDESEKIDLIKMPISEAIQKIMNGEIRTATTVAGILLVNRLIHEGKV